MNTLSMSIDIETYSSVDLLKSGVYAYADSPDFKILLFVYAFNDDDVEIIDIEQGEKLPGKIVKALTDKDILKTAYNANFERTCIQKFFNINLLAEQWRCSAVLSSELGLPQTLLEVAARIGVEEQKDSKRKNLIRYFSKPCKPTKINSGRTRNLPVHNLEKWEEFKEYCKQDVRTERAIKNKISIFPLPEREQILWKYDQIINDRGVKVDMQLIENAIKYNEIYKNKCLDSATKLTGLQNPNSVVQLKKWIYQKTGMNIESLNKENMEDLLNSINNQDVKKVLKLRAEMSKTSISKYEAMTRSICRDCSRKA